MLRRILIGAVGVLLIGDAVGLAALPSGARHLSGVVPTGNRIVINQLVGRARVLVLSEGASLRLLVAYERHGRWHSVRVDPAPTGSHAAWAATEGAGPVPAFSAVYGKAPGDKVVIRWHDGQTSPVVPVKVNGAAEGVYLAVRRGHVRPDGVDLNPGPPPSGQ